MKKIIYFLLLIISIQFGYSQNKGLEKSMYTIQTGFLGFWLNNESKLANEISLRTEIGFDAGISGGDFVGKTVFGLAPKIAIEPRWYYNLEKRTNKGKFTAHNSANFVTIGFNYIPDWFVLSNVADVSVNNQISIIPKWGIRRAIAKSNFNYELGIGIGKRYYLDANVWETAADLHLRVGYSF